MKETMRYCGADLMTTGQVDVLATKGVMVSARECLGCRLGCPQAGTATPEKQVAPQTTTALKP